MPLNPKASVSHNISEMVHAGHPQNQAVAAALNVARNAKAMGGAEDGNPRQLNSMGLYSQAAEVAKSLPQARGTPQQMVASLKGIKQDELTNSNVMGTFGNQPYVTRDQLVQHFQKSLPNIEEKQIKGGGIDENRKKNWILKNAIDSAVNTGDIDHSRDWDDADNDVKNWHIEIANNEFNKNYAYDDSFKDNFLKENATKYEKYTIPNGTDYRELLLKLKGSPLYRSSHWENDPNVVVHLRMKNRDEGKTLHLEELQSDWGQDYRKSEAEPAPYITSTNSWTDLGLKRALIEAAKGGHERLTWTPGLYQAKLYNLSDEKQQGMKGYYDNILPSRLQDIIKRLGHEPKFEPYNINNEIPAQSLRITPELRQTILKGISAFERGGYVPYATGGGLYANIHAKQERIAHGSHEHMRRPGVKGAPTAEAFRASERTAKADGGDFSNNQKLRQIPQLNHLQPAPTMGNKVIVHEGPIHSPVAGRTDHLPMHVKSGSYVIPADIIGAMGEGNTMAGFKVARRMFSSNPYFQKSMSPYGSSSPIYNSDEKPYGARAAGGGTPGNDDLVPIVAAGGEYVISPQDVTRLGEGDIDKGHKLLDSFVTKYRKKTIKVLQNLPGPKRD